MRGEATIEVRTDSPEERFAIGSILKTDPEDKGPLKIIGAKVHSGTLLLSFEGYNDRSAVERLRNVLLLAEITPADSNVTEDDFPLTLTPAHEVFPLTVIESDANVIKNV